MTNELDFVERYGMAQGFVIRPRTVLVEGTTDVELFQFAARLEWQKTGINLLNGDISIVAAGERDRGGTYGVIRELLSLRGMARTCLLPSGIPRYRFMGLFDNDNAGKEAVTLARKIDTSILEYKDVYRLWPIMPLPGIMDPGAVQRAFDQANANYKRLEWELEDFLPQSFFEAFIYDYPTAVSHTTPMAGKVHRDLTRDGKAKFHRFIKLNAVHADLIQVIDVIKAIRFYLNCPACVCPPDPDTKKAL